ncbi:MAG: hypothetical protein HYV75_06910 [Opitutae bacterium]|nr:hypothetical protein [Opitutae bacterium]
MKPLSVDSYRVGLLVLGAALLVNVHFLTINLDGTLVGVHSFRQAQTALSTYYLQGNLSLDYITPLFGPPWQIPLEFPLFQICAALCANWTGLELDAAGRLTSWLFFISALPAVHLLLAEFRLPRESRLYFQALLLLSPMVKITSGVVFLFAAGLWTFALLPPAGGARMRFLAWAALAALVSLGAGLAWTVHAKAVRDLNPAAQFLNAAFGFWTFGDLAQRFSWTFWFRTFRVWADSIAGESGLLLLAVYFVWLRGRFFRPVLGCLVVFLSGQLIFSNLYWVHSYYFYANSLFLLAAVGFCLAEIFEHPAVPRWGARLLLVAVLGLQLSAYERTYHAFVRDRPPIPPVAELVAAVSQPDEIVIVFGQDWDATLPYYSGRKALMLRSNREEDLAVLRQSLARVDRNQIAAVVLMGGQWRDTDFVRQVLPGIPLGPQPFLFDGIGIGIWVPEVRQPALRAVLQLHRYAGFKMSPLNHIPAEGVTLLARQIQRREEFDQFNPRPVRAFARHDFTYVEIDQQRMLLAHSPTELTFMIPPGANRMTAVFGLLDNSYTGGNNTDGIELVVSHRPPLGAEQTIYSRQLDPRSRKTDRGPQSLDVPLPAGATGELIVRLLPGPNLDFSFDWSYFGQAVIR